MYNKVDTNLNFMEREKNVEQFWRDNDIFKKSMEQRKQGPTYTFYDGPPTANGKPHIGHLETRVIKDMIPRYRTMKGYYVPRKAGWDTHGLPVELEVEKMLGLDGKDQIEQYGLVPFIDKCKESVWKYKGMWEKFSDTVGFWADMDNPYITYDDNYIESEWWALKQIWDKNLLYKGFKIVPYCPRCGTPLSAQEVAQGYKDVKERSAVVRFKVVGEDAYFLAWTTTPWTLPSNVALCVNPNEAYCKVKAADGYTYYMAEALLDTVLGKLNAENPEAPAYEVLETYTGKDLEYKAYEPLFDCAVDICKKQNKKAYYVTCDTYVTLTDGTGVVHIAPAFGEDDSRVGREYDLPFVQFVDGKGNLTAETPYAGVFVKKADPMVLTDLERKSLAGERELLTMLTSYPDLFRTYADRICSIEWVDPRHESIAWAVLATPPGTDPAACMDAARSVCPEAATLVSAGRISATSKHPTETNIVFMLDTLELYTIKRRMRAAQAKLRQDRSLDDEARRVLTMQAVQDSQRQRELQKSIGGVADPFRLIGLETAGAEQA